MVRPTGILKESLLDLPGARARVREESADFTAWRVKTFGGNFDPVREAVEDAVAEFSDRQPARDRSLWLKIANKIGYEAFRDLYLEQCAIMRECKLRNPSAAFQCMVGSRLPRQSAASIAEMPCRPRGSLRPLRFARALVFDCAASLRSKASSAHLASRATPFAHYKLRSL